MITTTMNPVQAFLDKVNSDAQLRKQLESLHTRGPAQAYGEIVKIAKKAGFRFTTKEYQEYARTICAQKMTGTIGDEQLISIACGCCQ